MVRLFALQRRVVGHRDPDKNAGLRFGDPRRNDARALERLPSQFQQQTLLWVDPARFAGRNPEKPGIELVDVGDESAGARIHFAGFGRIRMVIGVDIPAVVRDLGNGVRPGSEQRPEFRHVRSTRKPTGQSDQGDREGSSHAVTFCRHAHAHILRSPPMQSRFPPVAHY